MWLALQFIKFSEESKLMIWNTDILRFMRITLRNITHTNFHNEEHTLGLARYPNSNSLIRNLFRTKRIRANKN